MQIEAFAQTSYPHRSCGLELIVSNRDIIEMLDNDYAPHNVHFDRQQNARNPLYML